MENTSSSSRLRLQDPKSCGCPSPRNRQNHHSSQCHVRHDQHLHGVGAEDASPEYWVAGVCCPSHQSSLRCRLHESCLRGLRAHCGARAHGDAREQCPRRDQGCEPRWALANCCARDRPCWGNGHEGKFLERGLNGRGTWCFGGVGQRLELYLRAVNWRYHKSGGSATVVGPDYNVESPDRAMSWQLPLWTWPEAQW
jgi:hypothetical protein